MYSLGASNPAYDSIPQHVVTTSPDDMVGRKIAHWFQRSDDGVRRTLSTYPALEKRKALIQKKSSKYPDHRLWRKPDGMKRLVLTAQFQEQWRSRAKWIEARLICDVGRLQEQDLVELTGLGIAAVCNVVSIRTANDLIECLGPRLTGLGLSLPPVCTGMEAVQHLCQSVNWEPRLLETGRLILFNLSFLAAEERESAASEAPVANPNSD